MSEDHLTHTKNRSRSVARAPTWFARVAIVVLPVLTLVYILASMGSCRRGSPFLESAVATADAVVAEAVRAELVPGAVLLIAHNGKTVHHEAYGYAQLYEYGGLRLTAPPPMTRDHVFDLASLTKVFATTFAIMLLVDQGRLEPDQAVREYLPRFAGPSKDSVTVRHLLTHSGGLHEWKPLYYHAETSDETYAYIAQLPLAYPVGRDRHYSDLGFMLLGYIVEHVSGVSLDGFLSSKLYEPLGLQSTSFKPRGTGPFAATSHGNPFERRMVADDDFGYLCDEDPDDFQSWRQRVLVGEVNDGNAFHANGGVAGHAGLFSTASELQILVNVLLNRGVYRGIRFIAEDVVEQFVTRNEFGHGLGWAMSAPALPASDLPVGAFGHTGFTGTYVLVLPSHRLSAILLTNRQNTGVDSTGRYPSVTALRREVSQALIGGMANVNPDP